MEWGILLSTILIDLLLTVSLYSLPIIIYRYAVRKAPVELKLANRITIIYGVCVFILMTVLISWATDGEEHAGAAIIIWSEINHRILCGRWSWRVKDGESQQAAEPSPVEGENTLPEIASLSRSERRADPWDSPRKNVEPWNRDNKAASPESGGVTKSERSAILAVVCCVLVLAGIAVIGIISGNGDSSLPDNTASTAEQATYEENISTESRIDEPESGELIYASDYDTVYDIIDGYTSNLCISAYDDFSSCVLLKSRTGICGDVAYYVRAGDTVNVGVPWDYYCITYASGVNWRDTYDLFGAGTFYKLATDKEYDFISTDNYFISLENPKAENINADEFVAAPPPAFG